MKKSKKGSILLSVFITIWICIVAVLSINAAESAEVASGTCGAEGDNLTWTFDSSTGKLTISGTGDMADYDIYLEPWSFYRRSIKEVEIGNGVTSIGYCAFDDYSSLESVTFGENSELTSIGSWAFDGCDSLTSIEIPSSVTSIGEWAFSDCSSLESVAFGENSELTSIGRDAFSSCSNLTSIEIPSSVTSIGVQAFMNCSSLESVAFGENSELTSIGSSAFLGCDSLTSIEIPSSVTSIGEGAFSGCIGLREFIVDDANEFYQSIDGILFSEDGATLICYPTGKTDDRYVIPSSVTSIGAQAFFQCSSLTSIEIPSSVMSIGERAFWGCGGLREFIVDDANEFYQSIDGILFSEDGATLICYPEGKTDDRYVIPSSVTSIGDSAFSYCGNLTSIEIPSSVTSIGDNAFNGCSGLTSIEIPSSVTSIGGNAFMNCSSLTSIEIPSSVTSIGGNAFMNCSSLTSIVIPESVTSIGSGAFYGCRSLYVIYNNSDLTLTIGSTEHGYLAENAILMIDKNGDKVYKEDGTEYIDTEDKFLFTKQGNTYRLIAYFGGEETITLPVNIDGNSYEIYQMRGVRNVIVPSGVTSIGDQSFYQCSSLTSIVIPSSVTSIGAVFYSCSSLERITILSRDVEIYGGSSNIPSTATIYGYAGSTAQAYAEKYDRKFIPLVVGDLNGDNILDSDDAVYLLWHTFMPDDYPIYSDCDFNQDDVVDSNDAIYLLWHTFMPDVYPIK